LLLFIYIIQSQICPYYFGLTDVEILGYSAVSNIGTTVVTGSVAVSAGSAIVGFPPGVTIPTPNNLHNNDAYAGVAQVDAMIIYNSASAKACTATFVSPTDIGGMTFSSGVYCFSSSLTITGTVTLDGLNDPNAHWIFKTGSTLVTASGAIVNLVNQAIPCQVLWIVGSSTTLGTGTTMIGNIVSAISITSTTGSHVNGRLWARTGAVTLDTNIDIIPVIYTIVNNTVNGTETITTNCTTTNTSFDTVVIVGDNSTTYTNITTCQNCTFYNGTLTTTTYVCSSVLNGVSTMLNVIVPIPESSLWIFITLIAVIIITIGLVIWFLFYKNNDDENYVKRRNF